MAVASVTKNICIWGDSITYGAWDSEGGWADRLRRHLHGRTLRTDFGEFYWVYNLGIPSDTSDDILRRFEAEYASREPHIAVFAIGINDASRDPETEEARVSLDRFKKNMGSLLKRAREGAEKTLSIGLTTVDEKAVAATESIHHIFSPEQIAIYDNALRELCGESGIPFLDMQHAFAPEDFVDGLHPNTEGHRKMFENIADFLYANGVFSV